MPLPYGDRMRKAMYEYVVVGFHTPAQKYAHFKLLNGPCLDTIRECSWQFCANGTYKRIKKPSKRGNNRMSSRHIQALSALVEKEPRLYLDEMRDHLQARIGHRYSTTTIWRALHARAPYGLDRTWQVVQRRAREASERERQLFRATTREFDPAQML